MEQTIPEPALFLDASTPNIQAGVFCEGRWLSLRKEQGDAISLVPELMRQVLDEAGLKVAKLRALVHCEGPGSLLGLRIAAMCLETWRAIPRAEKLPLYAYRSLEAARAMHAANTGKDGAFATAFRKGSYCLLGQTGTEYSIVDEATLASLGESAHVIAQRHCPRAPEGCMEYVYVMASLPLAIARTEGLLRLAHAAEVFSPSPSEYKLWDGERHRAATPSPRGSQG